MNRNFKNRLFENFVVKQIFETFHESDLFNEVVKSATNILMNLKKDVFLIGEKYFTGWSLNKKTKLLIKNENSIYKFRPNLIPICISVDDLPPDEDAASMSPSENPDEIIVAINREKLYNFKKIEIEANLKHEFLHVLQGYALKTDVLNSKKNIGPNFVLNDFQNNNLEVPFSKNFVQELGLTDEIVSEYKSLLYFDSSTEREARLNSLSSFVKNISSESLKNTNEL